MTLECDMFVFELCEWSGLLILSDYNYAYKLV